MKPLEWAALLVLIWMLGFIPVWLITDNDDVLVFYAVLPAAGPLAILVIAKLALQILRAFERLKASLTR